MFLSMFLFFGGFQPGCSYKRCSYKKSYKKKGVVLIKHIFSIFNSPYLLCLKLTYRIKTYLSLGPGPQGDLTLLDSNRKLGKTRPNTRLPLLRAVGQG